MKIEQTIRMMLIETIISISVNLFQIEINIINNDENLFGINTGIYVVLNKFECTESIFYQFEKRSNGVKLDELDNNNYNNSLRRGMIRFIFKATIF